MTKEQKAAIIERLKESVQLLALPPEVQLQHLPSHVCKADELALDFDQWREVALGNYANDFTAQQLSWLNALDDRLNSLTDAGKQYWTDDAVRTSPHWNEVRYLAGQVLDSFGWPKERPPSHASEYKSVDESGGHSIN